MRGGMVMISNDVLGKILAETRDEHVLSKDLIEKILTKEMWNTSKLLDSNALRTIVFKALPGNTICCVNKQELCVDYDKILQFYQEKYFSIYEIQATLLHALFHEMEHVKQTYKLKFEGIDADLIRWSDFSYLREGFQQETKLHKICSLKIFTRMFFHQLSYKESYDTFVFDFYNKLYAIVPKEKIANVDALKLLKKSFENYPYHDSVWKKLYQELSTLLHKSFINGYSYDYATNQVSVPLKEYLVAIHHSDGLKELPFYSENYQEFLERSEKAYNLELRMRYSLPIRPEEYSHVKRLTKLTKGAVMK